MKKLWILLILTLALTACQFTPNIKAPSVFAGRTCGISCWNNIVVGKTNRQEFLTIISNLSGVDQGSILYAAFDNSDGSKFSDERITLTFYQDPNNKDFSVKINALILNQKIIFLDFNGDLGVTYQDITNLYGAPDLVSGLPTFDGGINLHVINSVNGWESTGYFDSEESSILPDAETRDFGFFDISMRQQFLTYLSDGALCPWVGYGKIDELYCP